MTRIDFYLLASSDPETRRVTACKLIEKAYRQGHRIYLQTDSEEETRMMDDLLWTFRQGSFVPHELHPDASSEAPVLVGHGAAPEGMADVLVNLGSEVPSGFVRFERIAELVDQDAGVKQAGRIRYKRYKEAGCALETHTLDKFR